MLVPPQEAQAGIQSSKAMPVTSCQQQASVPTGVWGENAANESIPSAQEVLSFIAFKCFQNVDPSNREELNGFLRYMRDVRQVVVLDTQQGSLIITVECSSLEILEGLWEDYRTGVLNAKAQKYLVTEHILKEFGLTEVRLTTTILEDEYKACREYFLLKPGENERLLVLILFFHLPLFISWATSFDYSLSCLQTKLRPQSFKSRLK